MKNTLECNASFSTCNFSNNLAILQLKYFSIVVFIAKFMLQNQHIYEEISADRSIPKPHQLPQKLYFDTLILE